MSEWQPIETAPKDGSRILAACFSHRGMEAIGLVRHDGDDWEFERGEYPPGWTTWTHWMPAPPVPERITV